MKIWTRDDTRNWIDKIESRIEDIDYYLKRTIEFCEINDVYSDRQVLILSMMTVLWVSHMRQEYASFNEMADLLGIDNVNVKIDQIYDLGPHLAELDHEEMLQIIMKSID